MKRENENLIKHNDKIIVINRKREEGRQLGEKWFEDR